MGLFVNTWFCPNCGYQNFEKDGMKCTNCGQEREIEQWADPFDGDYK